MDVESILKDPGFQQALNHVLAEQVVRIKLRSDIAANWGDANPELHMAEVGVEEDTGHLKIGDGGTPWNDLNYFGNVVWGTPASASDTGERGMVKYDGSYLYLCVGTNTWRRIAHSSWS